MTRGRPFGLIARDGTFSTRDAGIATLRNDAWKIGGGSVYKAPEEMERCEAISRIWEKFKLRNVLPRREISLFFFTSLRSNVKISVHVFVSE